MSNVLTGKVVITAPGVAQTMQGVATSVTKATATLKQIPNASNQATLALGNLGRVAQDAPFGFLGIANNLNPLLESFQRLKVTTGTTGGALKALGSSLLGAGGLGFALSVASSLLITFGDRLFGGSKAAKAAKEANEELAKSISGDLTKLTVLVGIVQNLNTSTDNRTKALQALNEQYGKYLPNLDKEGITAANIAKSYDLITDALLRQAVVKGIQEQIAESVKKTATEIIRLQTAEETRRLASEKASNATKDTTTALDKAAAASQRYYGTVKDGQVAQQAQRNEFNKNVSAVTNYDARVQRLTDSLKQQLAPLLNLTTNFQDLDITLNKPKSLKVPKVDDFIPKLPPLKIAIPLEYTIDQARIKAVFLGAPPIRTFKQQVEDNINKDIAKLVVAPRFNFSAEFLANQANIKRIQDAAQVLGDTFNSAIITAFTDGFASIGEGIGNLLSGKDFGNQLFQVIGSLLESVGKALIKFGIVKTGIDKLLKNPAIPGGVALGLGIFAIAAGTLVKNIKGARAAGGPVDGGGTYLVGEKGPELFTPNTGGQITPNHQLGGMGSSVKGLGGNFIFRIAGKDLVAVYALANQSNNRLV